MAAVMVVVGVGGGGVKGTTVAAARWAVPLASAPSRSDRLARVCEALWTR
jgi:phage terminase large subunit-like protein